MMMRRRVVVANEEVWSRETEIVGEESAPRNGWVEGVENMVECILFRWVKGRFVFGAQNKKE